MSFVHLLGLAAAVAMVLTYALEHRGSGHVLAFAVACAAAAVYAGLIGSVPFALLEAVWAGVALQRWSGRRRPGGEIACQLQALEPEQRERRAELVERFRTRVAAWGTIRETAHGFLVGLPAEDLGTLRDAVELLALERRCCPFLCLELRLPPHGSRVTLEVCGPRGVKPFLRDAFVD